MNSLLIGNGYWGNIIKPKLEKITNLVGILDSKSDINYYLKNYDIDIVFVCSSTKSHYEIVKKCILNNKNVFCEKPFTGDYNDAKELILLSKEKKIKLFIDNVFFYKEFIISTNEFKNIKFIWNKYDTNFNENLYDSLLYHDIYLLLKIYPKFNINDFKISENINKETELILKLQNENKTIEFKYDRNKNIKEKIIIMDDNILDFNKYNNDTLSEILIKINNGFDIDFDLNNEITLKTLEILKIFKNGKI